MRMVLDLGTGPQQVAVNYDTVKGNNMPRCHSHPYYELYYITEGERYLLVKDRFYHLIAGDIFLIAPGAGHRTLDVNDDKYTRFTASIGASVLPQNCLERLGDCLHIVRPSAEVAKRIAEEADILLRSIKNEERGIEALSAVLKMVYLLLCEEDDGEMMAVINPTLDRMSGILTYLEQHYKESVSIASLSEKFYISEFYLCRLFKEYTGKTIISYLTELRIRNAVRSLKTTDDSVKKISRACGYGSLSAFGKAFNSLVGMSPREYRKRIKGGEGIAFSPENIDTGIGIIGDLQK